MDNYWSIKNFACLFEMAKTLRIRSSEEKGFLVRVFVFKVMNIDDMIPPWL